MLDDDDDNSKAPADDDGSDSSHQIQSANEVKEGGEDEEQFDAPIASPSVTGEENVFSGDAPEGEAADIDDEMEKAGLKKQDHEDPDNY